MPMPIKIKLSTGERIRRAVAADPSMSTDEIVSKLRTLCGLIDFKISEPERY